jgi:hypothetical protein
VVRENSGDGRDDRRRALPPARTAREKRTIFYAGIDGRSGYILQGFWQDFKHEIFMRFYAKVDRFMLNYAC